MGGGDSNFPSNIGHMFESFHQSSKGDFKPTFYNPFEVKHRKRTTKNQYKVLERVFMENPKPNNIVRRNLAAELGMSPRGVQVWFQNRRAKRKQQESKSSDRVRSESDTSSMADSEAPPGHSSILGQNRILQAGSSSFASTTNYAQNSKYKTDSGKVVDDIYLPDHIYNPDQSSAICINKELLLPLSPQASVAKLDIHNIAANKPVQQVKTVSNMPASKFTALKNAAGSSKTQSKRSRAHSCPNVLDSLPFDELHSLLFSRGPAPPADAVQTKETAPQTNNGAKRQMKRGTSGIGKPLLLGGDCRTDTEDSSKRPRSISVPSLTWNAPKHMLHEVKNDNGAFFNPYAANLSMPSHLPQMAAPLKPADDAMLEQRKQRRNSGCSMNFLNSFINMGFIPEDQLGNENQMADPYYQAIMKGGKLGLQDMYLCPDANGLEPIEEIDQSGMFLANPYGDQMGEVTWNSLPYNQSYAEQGQMNQYFATHSAEEPVEIDDVSFEYLHYMNPSGGETLFGNSS